MSDFFSTFMQNFQQMHLSMDETLKDDRLMNVTEETKNLTQKVKAGMHDYENLAKIQAVNELACQQNPLLASQAISMLPFCVVNTAGTREEVKEQINAYFSTQDGKVFFKEKAVCNFVVQIIGYTVYEHEKGKGSKTYNLEISCGRKTVMHKATPKELRSEEFYLNLSDFPSLAVYDKNLFRQYITWRMENFDGEKETVYDFSGWHTIDGRQYYVASDGVVGEHMKVRSQGNLKLRPQMQRDNSSLWHGIENLFGLAGTPGVVMLLYLIQSLLYSFYQKAGVAPKFILFIVGDRNVGKTSVALNLFKMAGREAGTQMSDYNFLSTPAGLEQGIKDFHDAVMICDDLMPSADSQSRAAREGNLELLVRVFGDATEKKRNTDFLSDEIAAKIDYRAKGGCVVTGEYFAGVQSSLTRMVILELTREDICWDLLSASQNDPGILLNFVYDFLSFATKEQDGIIQHMRTEIPRIRQEIEGKYAAARYAENFATLYVAAQILITYLQDRRFMDNSKGLEQFRRIHGILDKIMQKNSNILNEQSDEYVICHALEDFYYVFQERHEWKSSSDIELLEDEKFIYLRAEMARKVVTEWQKDHGIRTCFPSERAFLKACETCGLIYVATEGERRRLTHKLPHKGKDSRRYAKFYKNKVLQEGEM